MGYIKYSKDKKELSRFLNNSQMMKLDNDAARVIRDIIRCESSSQGGDDS
ncbi:MAG: hypothetical protein ACLVEI_02190 [Anaerobutyricum soehngenii]